MTEQQFVYWLQGFAELNEVPPTAEQWQSIREHLATVFKKVTPQVGGVGPSIQKDLAKMFEEAKQDKHIPAIGKPWPGIKPDDIIC